VAFLSVALCGRRSISDTTPIGTDLNRQTAALRFTPERAMAETGCRPFRLRLTQGHRLDGDAHFETHDRSFTVGRTVKAASSANTNDR
jgi:hypothetical protein